MALSFMFCMDILGTIAFAISGAMVAIKKEMDIFGVNILAIITAVGGGMLRDVLIGDVPPEMFQNPIYTLVAVIIANSVFVYAYWNKKNVKSSYVNLYEKTLFLFDTLGLAVFTVDGVNAGMHSEFDSNMFLVVFLGVITGVGGGVLRDTMANELPYIFVKHIYACASILGAVVTVYCWKYLGENPAIFAGFFVIIVIRLLAAHYKWDLPRVVKK
ncbi:trimeric intracellular cation channel family protein [Roseburia sp. 499]|uniref:trimeric intracellular cation channel family protein n=1 Tax=Roseburia sp. 499 TaxID=1261634 RepID=UPI0009FAE716|nr:trimeric intracellular cation channel family protein [Roseburia sp. 499]WVK69443.1 trimeric intracellular cation channel family protein [Roseburia sp. 499]